MQRATCTLLLALLATVALAPADAQALRCRNRIVAEGAELYFVRELCGPPSAAERWTEVRRLPIHRRGHPYAGSFVGEIRVEQWIYDLGPRRLVRRLRFENGRLARIETLRYGR